jgi:hypothetical protein
MPLGTRYLPGKHLWLCNLKMDGMNLYLIALTYAALRASMPVPQQVDTRATLWMRSGTIRVTRSSNHVLMLSHRRKGPCGPNTRVFAQSHGPTDPEPRRAHPALLTRA